MTTLDYDVTFQTYDEPTQGDGLVRFQWRNGERKRKSGGYFFLPGIGGIRYLASLGE